MAITQKISRLKPDDNVKHAIATIVGVRVEEIASHREAFIKDPSADALHDLRVALRRLEAVLESFADVLPRKKIKRFRKTIEKTIRLLGAVREYDIILGELREFRTSIAPEEQPALVLLDARYEQKRRRQIPQVKRGVRKLLTKEFLDDLSELALHQLQKSSRKRSTAQPEDTFQKCLAERLLEQLNELLHDSRQVFAQPDKLELLHELRIKAKPFRYLYEIGSMVLPDLETGYGRVKQLLERLGSIHDVDTIVPVVKEHSAELTVFNRQAGRPDDRITTRAERRLLVALNERRSRMFLDAKTIFHRWNQDGEADRIMTLTQT